MAEAATNLSPAAVAEIVEGLTQSLAETSVTTMKAQNFHWNVTGMAFGPLHALFQEIYEDHFVGQDELAERIKAIGGFAEGRYAVYLDRSRVPEHDGRATDKEMIADLQASQEQISATLRALAMTADKH
ncbi:MAG: DNA starvation/stationary phase protection protein, partial [Pseudomonadota bacterium]